MHLQHDGLKSGIKNPKYIDDWYKYSDKSVMRANNYIPFMDSYKESSNPYKQPQSVQHLKQLQADDDDEVVGRLDDSFDEIVEDNDHWKKQPA